MNGRYPNVMSRCVSRCDAWPDSLTRGLLHT